MCIRDRYQPLGSGLRDVLEFSRLIDLWSSLGIPLQVTLAFPSSNQPDPLAKQGIEVGHPVWKDHWSQKTQADWVRLYLPVLMSKPSIVSVSWSHLSDTVAHRYPNAGLLDSDGNCKQVTKEFEQLQIQWNQSH